MSPNHPRKLSAHSGSISTRNSVLTADQLKHIANHRYSVTGQSFLEPYMQEFWTWAVEQIPRWWAPNALTLAGMFCLGATSSILLLYSPDGRSQCPQWSFLLCGLGIFVYQTLDAIDGKQARRTHSCSPVGELFDHGCDAISMLFAITAGSVALGLGTWPSAMFFECFTAVFLYYGAHWQTYCSGSLQFGRFDVTESQFAAMLVHFITGVYGQSLWDKELVTGVPIKIVPFVASVVAALVTTYGYFKVVFAGGIGKNGSTVAGSSVLSPCIPISLVILMAVYSWNYSSVSLYERHPVLFIMSFGLAASKLSIRLVISYMSRTPMCLIDSTFAGPLLLSVNLYFSLGLNEYCLLWLCFIYCTLDLLYYSITVCRVLCSYLGIYCFRVAAVATTVSRLKQSPVCDNALLKSPLTVLPNGFKQ